MFHLQTPEDYKRLVAADNLLRAITGEYQGFAARIGDRLKRNTAREMIAEALELINQCDPKFVFEGKITCGTVKEAKRIALAISQHIRSVALRQPAPGVIQSEETRGQPEPTKADEKRARRDRRERIAIGVVMVILWLFATLFFTADAPDYILGDRSTMEPP